MNGGPGYILSREALKRFVEVALKNSTLCKPSEFGWEDLEMDKCLDKVGVRAGDSRDSEGRHRMLPLAPGDHLSPLEKNEKVWFQHFSYYPYEQVPRLLFLRRILLFQSLNG